MPQVMRDRVVGDFSAVESADVWESVVVAKHSVGNVRTWLVWFVRVKVL